MSDNQNRYTAVLERIIELTKNSSLSWNYLDSEQELYEGMHWTKSHETFSLTGMKEVLRPGFDTENSFCSYVNGTYIVILTQRNQPATVYIVPSTYKKVVKLSAELYGDLITRLLNIVASSFPDAEAFIDELLK